MPLPKDSPDTMDPTETHIVGKEGPMEGGVAAFSLSLLGGLCGPWGTAPEPELPPPPTPRLCVSTPGIQSPEQQSALARHDPARPIFVEGPFSLWLRDKCVYYHILRADLLPPEERVRAQSGSQGSGKSELAQRSGGG